MSKYCLIIQIHSTWIFRCVCHWAMKLYIKFQLPILQVGSATKIMYFSNPRLNVIYSKYSAYSSKYTRQTPNMMPDMTPDTRHDARHQTSNECCLYTTYICMIAKRNRTQHKRSVQFSSLPKIVAKVFNWCQLPLNLTSQQTTIGKHMKGTFELN